MDKYLKMADVFGDVVTQKLVGDAYEIMSHSYGHVCVVNTEERADMVAHAINSHDELVAEVERLRMMISECYPYINDKADCGNEYEVDLSNRLFDAAK